MKKSNFLLILFLVAVVSIPIAYSATEPSVIINMIFGQTEKPLIIKDNLGQEVFSVDVDGTVFPAPVVPPAPAQITTVQSLRFILIGEDSQPFRASAQTIDEQKVLAKFRVDFNSPQIDNGGFAGFPPVYITHFWLSNFLKSDTGDFTNVAIAESFDDITFTERYTNGDSSTLYIGTDFDGGSDTFCKRTNISQNQCFITFGWFVDGQDQAFLRDAIFELGIILPADTTITQIFP